MFYRLEMAPEPLFEAFEPGDLSGACRVLLAVVGYPANFLGAPTDVARKVDAPGIVFGIERKRLQRHGNLCGPAVVCALGRTVPA